MLVVIRGQVDVQLAVEPAAFYADFIFLLITTYSNKCCIILWMLMTVGPNATIVHWTDHSR